MAISFDYESETKADAVLSVADAIRSSGRVAPLTEEQKIQRRIEMEDWQEQERWRAEDRRAEIEGQQAEAEAVARHEAAVELAEKNRQTRERMRLEYQQRAAERSRDLDLSIVRNEAQAQSNWRNLVQSSLWQKQTQAILDDMYRMVNPPPPSPEMQGLDQLREEISDLKRQLDER